MIALRRTAGRRAWPASLLVAVAGCLIAAAGSAAVPARLNYQGYLTDAIGALNGTYDMTFRLYADSTGGAALWTEAYAGVRVSGGVFNVLLGSLSPLSPSMFDGRSLWIETQVGGATLGPRSPIVTVAYATRAAVADSAVHGPQPWTESGANVYRASGRVGIDTSDPQARLHTRLDGGTFDNYALFQTSPGTGYAGGILLGNSAATSGTAFKMTSSYNFTGNGKARFGFINNNTPETFVNGGPAMEVDYATGNILLGQSGTQVSVGGGLSVVGDIDTHGIFRGTASDADKADGNHVALVRVYTASGTQYVVNTSYVQIYAYGTSYALKVTSNGSSHLDYFCSVDEGTPTRVGLDPGNTSSLPGTGARMIDLRIVAGTNYVWFTGVADDTGWITGLAIYQ
jgi:hypothetical protein